MRIAPPDFPASLAIYKLDVRMRQCAKRLPNGRLPPESARAWRKAWRAYVEGPNPKPIGISNLGILCSWGWLLAMEAGNYAEAVRRYEPWVSHPLFHPMQSGEWEHHQAQRMCALLYNAEAAKAARVLQSIVDPPARVVGKRVCTTALSLVLGFLQEQPQGYRAPRSLDRQVRRAAVFAASGLTRKQQSAPLMQLLQTARSLMQRRAMARRPDTPNLLSKCRPTPTRGWNQKSGGFINVDLELSARTDLSQLVHVLESKMTMLFSDCDRTASLVRAESALPDPKSADKAILDIARVLARLRGTPRAQFQGCSHRIFDVGFQAGSVPEYYVHLISSQSLAAVARAGAQLGVTIYPAAPPDGSRPRTIPRERAS